MGIWTTCSSGRCSCPWQGVAARWTLWSLPTQTFLCFWYPHLCLLLSSVQDWCDTHSPIFKEREIIFALNRADILLQKSHLPADLAPLYSLYDDPFAVGQKPILSDPGFKQTAYLCAGDSLQGAREEFLYPVHTSQQKAHQQPAHSLHTWLKAVTCLLRPQQLQF